MELQLLSCVAQKYHFWVFIEKQELYRIESASTKAATSGAKGITQILYAEKS